MNEDEKAILSEVENIINTSAEGVEDIDDMRIRHFKQIESELFKSIDFSDERSHLFYMVMVANTAEEVAEIHKIVGPATRHIPPDNLTDVPNRAMGISHIASSNDVYELLENRREAMEFATNDNAVGCIVRVGARATSTEDKEAKVRDVIITLMITDTKSISAITRFQDEPDLISFQSVDLESYEEGEQKLIDAMCEFFILPRAMRAQEPELFDALIKDLNMEEES